MRCPSPPSPKETYRLVISLMENSQLHRPADSWLFEFCCPDGLPSRANRKRFRAKVALDPKMQAGVEGCSPSFSYTGAEDGIALERFCTSTLAQLKIFSNCKLFFKSLSCSRRLPDRELPSRLAAVGKKGGRITGGKGWSQSWGAALPTKVSVRSPGVL